MSSFCESYDLLVFSPTEWDFVYHRPQHLLTRFAKYRRVFYFGPPRWGMTDIPRLHLHETTEGVQIVTPYLPEGTSGEDISLSLKDLVDELIFEEDLSKFTLQYYYPEAIDFTRHLNPARIIFDKIQGFSLLKGSSPDLKLKESELLERCQLVVTAGHSLYESCQELHGNVHDLPSSLDYHHFAQARQNLPDPEDQTHIPHPRLGFFGVIDERLNIEMLKAMAQLRPDLHIVLIGPVVEGNLPQLDNIHYLGKKSYQELPIYISGWDCAIMPFAHNEATRFICPSMTSQFLAAGKPVVSTSIRDVINPYADEGLIQIADTVTDFIRSCESASHIKNEDPEWINRVDRHLAQKSWDLTFRKMAELERTLPELQDKKTGRSFFNSSYVATEAIS